jgi:hypothetical protein
MWQIKGAYRHSLALATHPKLPHTLTVCLPHTLTHPPSTSTASPFLLNKTKCNNLSPLLFTSLRAKLAWCLLWHFSLKFDIFVKSGWSEVIFLNKYHLNNLFPLFLLLTRDATIQNDYTCVVVLKHLSMLYQLNLYSLANDTTLDLYAHLHYSLFHMLWSKKKQNNCVPYVITWHYAALCSIKTINEKTWSLCHPSHLSPPLITSLPLFIIATSFSMVLQGPSLYVVNI